MTVLREARGFTLLELVLALGLLGVGLMGTVHMTSGLLKHNWSARQRTVALYLARNKIESLCREPYEDISESIEEGLDAAGVSGKGIFRREVTVMENSTPAHKEIGVTVSFEGAGRGHVALSTLVAAP